MNVGELMAILEQFDENTEVRLMFQPNYPLQFTLYGVYEDQGVPHPEDYDDLPKEEVAEFIAKNTKEPIIYLLEGDHPYDDSPYGTRKAWDECQVCP